MAQGDPALTGERIQELPALSDAAEHSSGDITRFPSDSKSALLTFLSLSF